MCCEFRGLPIGSSDRGRRFSAVKTLALTRVGAMPDIGECPQLNRVSNPRSPKFRNTTPRENSTIEFDTMRRSAGKSWCLSEQFNPDTAVEESDSMSKGRLEAFSDGVIAILITIMVFDIKAPKGADWNALLTVVPVMLSYLMSFLYLGTYWNNHHHMMHAARQINGTVLWANLHLLFWLSFFPFTTSWLHVSGFERLPSALYGAVLLLAAIAYMILQITVIRAEGSDSRLRDAIGRDFNPTYSPACRFSIRVSVNSDFGRRCQ